LHDDVPFPSLEQENVLPMSLSPNLTPDTCSPKDVIEDLLVSAKPPTRLNDSFEFEVGEDLENLSELDMNVTSKVEHHDEAEAICFQESCEEQVEPTNLGFDGDILSVEYESFSCGFDANESLDEGFCVAYESFSFDPIIADLLFESRGHNFVEFKTIATTLPKKKSIIGNLRHVLQILIF